MSEFVKETRETRLNLPDCFQGEWIEVVIQPFDKTMTVKAGPDADSNWLQWGPEECLEIPAWFYCLLGLMWPLLKWVYTKPLVGQSTDW